MSTPEKVPQTTAEKYAAMAVYTAEQRIEGKKRADEIIHSCKSLHPVWLPVCEKLPVEKLEWRLCEQVVMPPASEESVSKEMAKMYDPLESPLPYGRAAFMEPW